MIISPPASVISFSNVSNLSVRLAPTTNFAPFAAKIFAVEFPIPLLAPVIIITLSLIKFDFCKISMRKYVFLISSIGVCKFIKEKTIVWL